MRNHDHPLFVQIRSLIDQFGFTAIVEALAHYSESLLVGTRPGEAEKVRALHTGLMGVLKEVLTSVPRPTLATEVLAWRLARREFPCTIPGAYFDRTAGECVKNRCEECVQKCWEYLALVHPDRVGGMSQEEK
jgi:hypothetical protein